MGPTCDQACTPSGDAPLPLPGGPELTACFYLQTSGVIHAGILPKSWSLFKHGPNTLPSSLRRYTWQKLDLGGWPATSPIPLGAVVWQFRRGLHSCAPIGSASIKAEQVCCILVETEPTCVSRWCGITFKVAIGRHTTSGGITKHLTHIPTPPPPPLSQDLLYSIELATTFHQYHNIVNGASSV